MPSLPQISYNTDQFLGLLIDSARDLVSNPLPLVSTAVFRVLAFRCLERKYPSRDVLERSGWTTSREHNNNYC